MKRVEEVIEKVLREDGKFSHLNIENMKNSEMKLFRPIPKYADTEDISIVGSSEIIPAASSRRITIYLPSKDDRFKLEFNVVMDLIKSSNNIFLTTKLVSNIKQDELQNTLDPKDKGLSFLQQLSISSFIIKESVVKSDNPEDDLEFYNTSIKNMIDNSSFAGKIKQDVKELIIKIIKYNIYDCYNIKPKTPKPKKRPGIIDDLKTDFFGNFDPIKTEDWKEIEGEYKGLKYEVRPVSYDDVWIYFLCGYVCVPHEQIKDFNLNDFWDDFNENGLDIDYMRAENDDDSTVYEGGFSTDHFGYKMEKYTPELVENVCKKLIDYTLDKIKKESED